MNLFCLTIWGALPLHFFASIVRQWSKIQHPVAAGNRKIYRRQKLGFVLIHIAHFFLKPQDVSYFSRFTSTNFSKPSWRILHAVVFFLQIPPFLWIGSNSSTRCGRVHFEHSYRKWLVITVRPTTSVRKSPRKNLPPRNTPDLFCRRFPRQNHRCAAWAVFFFFTNKILCSRSISQNLFLVVDCTTSKCYSYAWKKQDVVSTLCPAFFILNLESCISRLNVIPCHDLTLSVSEPDNAAAQTGAGTSFGANGDSHYMSSTTSTYFLRLNNSETFVENAFWAQR